MVPISSYEGIVAEILDPEEDNEIELKMWKVQIDLIKYWIGK